MSVTLTRIAHEIWERNRGMENLVLIGIRRRGFPIAQRLSQKLKEIAGIEIPVGALDINLYRDDLSEIDAQPVLKKTEIPFSVKGARVILCDDVLSPDGPSGQLWMRLLIWDGPCLFNWQFW